MIFDPVYFLFVLPGLALSMWASWRVKSTFNKYSKVRTIRGLTGAEAASELLRSAGIGDLGVAFDATSDALYDRSLTRVGSAVVWNEAQTPTETRRAVMTKYTQLIAF